VDDPTANRLQDVLLREAHKLGLNIAFGRDPDFGEAMTYIDDLYTCLPGKGAALDGHPCPASGAWPVGSPSEVSDHTDLRRYDRGVEIWRHYETEILQRLILPKELDGKRVAFFHNIDPEDLDRDLDDKGPASSIDGEISPSRKISTGQAGAAALGNRNRWAVICMDGNDMGSQFAEAKKRFSGIELTQWSAEMATTLDKCCRDACYEGLTEVLMKWVEATGIGDINKQCRVTRGNPYDIDHIILPVRPLLVGGDDIVILCHAAHAFTFAEAVSRTFTKESRKHPHLWPATSGELTISAGILFCSNSMPLATAVDYAEQLLSQAKQHGRKHQESDRAAPACVDWEIVTESVIDTANERRQRMVHFEDADLGNAAIHLTRKPYQISEIDELRTGKTATLIRDEIPRGINHKLREMLRHAYWDRKLGVVSLDKQQPELAAALREDEGTNKVAGSRWDVAGKDRSIDILDIIELVEEEIRLDRPTVTAGG
jgi:hypothetical protein